MKPAVFDYHAPRSVDEVVALLDELGEDAKVLAGGQSLVPLMNMRLAAPAALVDLARVDGLDTIEVADGAVRVEARVTHETLRRHGPAAAVNPLLRQALDLVAHPVIRNRGTTLGSIVHADPSGELPAVLALLDGEVELVSAAGVRRVTGVGYLLGPLESDTRADELATAVTFPALPARSGTAFVELSRRHGDYAVAGVGVHVTLDDDLKVASARAAFIGVGGTPVVVEVSDPLIGQAHDALAVDDAIGVARTQLHPATDIHATAEYRSHLAGVLLGRALSAAVANAARGEPANALTSAAGSTPAEGTA